MKISEIISKFKGEKNMSETKSYRLYFNDQQLKNMKEMPVKEQNDKGEWIQQTDPFGSPVTETRCIIDIPDTAYYLTKGKKRIDLKGFNLVMRNQFFRSEHDNGYYCMIEPDKKYRLDKIEPLKDENGEIKKTPDGKIMYDFDSKKSLWVKGKQLRVMMESWKDKEKDKKPLNLSEYKDKAEKYNESHSQEKDDIHKDQNQSIEQ